LPSERVPCERIWKSLVIYWNGEVTPCTNDYNGDLVVGNVKDNTIKNIWKGKKLHKLQNAHVYSNFKEFPLCNNCNEWLLKRDTDKYKNISKNFLQGHLQ